jgi:hypothetical protein
VPVELKAAPSLAYLRLARLHRLPTIMPSYLDLGGT